MPKSSPTDPGGQSLDPPRSMLPCELRLTVSSLPLLPMLAASLLLEAALELPACGALSAQLLLPSLSLPSSS